MEAGPASYEAAPAGVRALDQGQDPAAPAETGNPFRLAVCQDHWCQSVPVREERPRALRVSISFGKKLQSSVAPSYYLESLLCNAPTELSATKGHAPEGAYTCTGAFHAAFSERVVAESGLPPSRILMFRERLMNRLCRLSCWLV